MCTLGPAGTGCTGAGGGAGEAAAASRATAVPTWVAGAGAGGTAGGPTGGAGTGRLGAAVGPPSRRLSGTMTPAGGREGPAGTGARLGRWGGAPPWPSNVVVAGVDGAGGTDGEVAMAAAPDVPLGPPTATATGSSGGWERFRPSRSALRRTRSAWASSMLEEWLVTPMPIARHSSRPSLLVRPSSRASSYTRIFLAKFSASPFLGLQ